VIIVITLDISNRHYTAWEQQQCLRSLSNISELAA